MSFKKANDCFKAIPEMQAGALKTSRSLVTLECCANAPAYAKSDLVKQFVLWSAKRQGKIESPQSGWLRRKKSKEIKIDIIEAEGVREQHASMYQLFVQDDFVRFPFNLDDYSPRARSLNPESIQYALQDPDQQTAFLLPRFSTASRSCLVLIPESVEHLKKVDIREVKFVRRQGTSAPQPASLYPNLNEWNAFQDALTYRRKDKRFEGMVPSLKEAVSQRGITIDNQRYRLYSVKTGVAYVGSVDERGKDLLEANARLAMARSRVVQQLPNNDASFGVQIELLTVMAPLMGGRDYDGFQVRDLTCLSTDYEYTPAQAIPYIDSGKPASQVKLWRNNFAIPLGRAKARMFLQYGFIHSNANAQNFVLGFKGKKLRQIVVRDIGDTALHDVYIERFLLGTGVGGVLNQALIEEKISAFRQLLKTTADPTYPPPMIVRLAAGAVLSHGFADRLKSSGWSVSQLHVFVSGILEGFRSYVAEVLGLKLYGKAASVSVEMVMRAGKEGRYTYSPADARAYTKIVDECLEESSEALFSKALFISSNSKSLMAKLPQSALAGKVEGVSILTNAEELYLCAGVEKLLQEIREENTRYQSLQKRLDNLMRTGDWPAVVGA